MKRLVAVTLFLVGMFLPEPASASVDDFTFDSFDASYVLSRDESGRSTLTVVETLVARFPEFDQNRGIRRVIPASYLGTPSDISVGTVTDENGNAREYSVESDGEWVTITSAVPEGEFVRGVNTYVIHYTAHNVTFVPSDASIDEFYWDINGDGWPQPFGRVSVTLVLDESVESEFTGALSCYAGDYGSTQLCESITSSGNVIRAEQNGVTPYQTLTIAVGFNPGTFTERDSSYFASPVWPIHAMSVAFLVWLFVLTVIRVSTTGRNAPGRPTIIAEYGPPPGVSLVSAAALLTKTSRGFPAALVDLAVRGVVSIEEFDPPGFGRHAWSVRLAKEPSTADIEFVTAVFGHVPTVGTATDLLRNDAPRASRWGRVALDAMKSVLTDGFRRTIPRSGGLIFGLVLAMLAVMGTSIALLDDSRGQPVALATATLSMVLGIVAVAILLRRPYTETGAEVRDHIKGLDLYIQVAEEDRLRVLQSPQGALRKPVDVSDTREVLHLYELVLPWAVLLGREREWARVLETAYGTNTPSWYAGTTAFNAAAFAASVSSVSASASTSSGSSGGGSSGGGGGGGGGGGV